MPSTNLVGAFLKYGKLEAAEPCVGALDQCNKPTMTQFSKKFIFGDIEWTDDFLDPGMASTVEKMEEIAETVNRFWRISYIVSEPREAGGPGEGDILGFSTYKTVEWPPSEKILI